MTSFVAGGPLSTRRNKNIILERPELNLVLQRIQEKNNYNLLILQSPRQTGKTTLLFQIQNHFCGNEEYSVIYLDLSLFDNNIERNQFYPILLTLINKDLPITFNPENVVNRMGFYNYLDRVRVQTKKLTKIVILFNQISHLNHKIASDLFSLHPVNQNQDAKIMFILAGAYELNRFAKELTLGHNYCVNLQDFSHQQVITLGGNLQNFSDVFSEKISKSVYKWGNGHPYLTQRLFQLIDENEDIRKQEETKISGFIDELIEQYIKKQQDPNLNYIVNSLFNKIKDDSSYLEIVERFVNPETKLQEEVTHQQELLTLGILKRDNQGDITMRNKMYKEAFTNCLNLKKKNDDKKNLAPNVNHKF